LKAKHQLDKRFANKEKEIRLPPNPSLKIAMVDEDVISKVSELVNKSYFRPND
jgi:hypothetical protein